MSVLPIDPFGMTVTEWCDMMTPNLLQFGNLPRLDNPDNWREFGLALLNLPQLSGSIVPDPYQFERWDEWAMRLNKNLWSMA